MGDAEEVAKLRDKVYEAVESLEKLKKLGALIDISNFVTQAVSGLWIEMEGDEHGK
jgi:hypothetical protein